MQKIDKIGLKKVRIDRTFGLKQNKNRINGTKNGQKQDVTCENCDKCRPKESKK